ncbi:dienelactone hydrolase [Lentzea sp. NBRC 105346]|uniref:alpha/beta hydrolase family protein n=1 Tax=Lentzea sp. NBRC 105346 TaxID=3032205 RepID=UPI0024A2E374|nr:alpha/beta fold hydrolase [Lentzea sp. NBRC 105346]GLZ28856.1 dienelactone hydrolase [Lentzea sp. NBRC 105346]
MNAGCREFEIDDIRGHFMYPTESAERTENFGPYQVDVALDAPVAGTGFPLIAISHGTGGTHLMHRELAAHLARNGFVVAMPDHPGNNHRDDSLAHTVEILLNRPLHISKVIDHAHEAFGITTVGFIGHSLGGYTGLALAGGNPVAPPEQEGGEPRPFEVHHDDRIKAFVLLAPAAPWFPGDALKDVTAPILVRSAEKDPYTPPWHGEVIANGASGPVEHLVVPGAGHFSFQDPLPAELVRLDFEPSIDPEGFDRESYHETLKDDVLSFLRKELQS